MPWKLESQIKGGVSSQRKRRENPEFYRNLGCNVANVFSYPKKSIEVAELIGIILGDGGLTPAQLKITLNSEADKEYIVSVVMLIERLFSYRPSIYEVKTAKAKNIMVSGVDFVRYLINLGLQTGDKVRHQVGVPGWIKKNLGFSKACLRGLMDTDGGLFIHRYVVGGRQYSYLKLNFSNKSQPLRIFVFNVLKEIGLTPKLYGVKNVVLNSQSEVVDYMRVVGSSNERLVRKLRMV